MIKLPIYLRLDKRGLLWMIQVFGVVGFLGYGIGNTLGGNFLTSREALDFLPPSLHWFSVVIFVAIFLGYIVTDMRVNLLFIIPIGLVYYCLHEAIFNALFIPYNGFRDPAGAPELWYLLLVADFAVTLALIPLGYVFRDRLLRFTKSAAWKKAAAASWVALAVLYAVRIEVGFPVSINVYNIVSMYYTMASPIANGFELATNLIFAVAFFSTFDFTFRKKSESPTENPAAPGLSPAFKG